MAWKIYFWFLSVLLVISYAMIFTGQPAIWDLIDVLISAPALLGFFAYSFRKPLFNQKFWKCWFVIFIVWDVVYNLIITEYLGLAQQYEGSEESTITEMLIGYIIFLPEYIALYLLAFKADHIWGNKT